MDATYPPFESLDASGQITHYINVIEDVSSQVEVKQRLIERTARLNATFDLSPDGFAVFDAQGELITSNPALSHMLGKVPAWIPLERFDDWVRDLSRLRKLEPLATDPDFQQEWRAVKQHNKQKLAGIRKVRIPKVSLALVSNPFTTRDAIVFEVMLVIHPLAAR